ncbi:MAG: MFS transporter [Chloroflexi bacterium]|nr:MFS transporter [Chloroflexota bacterium]
MKDTDPREQEFKQASKAIEREVDIKGFHALPRRQVFMTMAGVMLAIFLASLDQTVVGTAMPRIIADLGGFDRYTWVTIAYMVASTTVVPIVGRLTDIYGRKWFYILGIAIFLLGSVLAGLSSTMNQLIAFRAFQGIGGGIMMANAFVTVGDLFAPSERGKYQGLISAVFGLSSIIGPMLGGLITDNLSWHWIFFVNIPLGIPSIALFMVFFPHIRPAELKHNLDYLGITTLVLAVVPLLLALSWGGVQYPWVSPQVLGFLSFASVMAILFILIEARVSEPILPLSIFSNPIVSISLLVIFLTGFGMFGGIIFVPLFFQGVLGSSATSSGSFLTPMMLGMVVGGTISGQALSRLGGHYRIQGLIGVSIMATGTFLLSRMSVDTSLGHAVFNIVLLGFGLGTTFPLFTIAVQNAVPYRVMGVATSSTQFFRAIGGTLGLAVLGSVMTNRFTSGLFNDLPPTLKTMLPPEKLSALAHNPQALVSPQGQLQLQSLFGQIGPQSAAFAQELSQVLRQALSNAIDQVFLIALFILVIAWVATLFLKEVPLRKSNNTGSQVIDT